MQVVSTKKSPGAFSGTRLFGLAITAPPFAAFYPTATVLRCKPFRTRR
jgi:hypothetical protein